jgi:hypothetical protein
MRRVANARNPVDGVHRCMVYACKDGAYLFLYESPMDGPCHADLWFESVSDACTSCRDTYGLTEGDWVDVDDPSPGCQHDWIAPVRLKRDLDGKPLRGRFQQLVDGAWVDISPAATDSG